MGKESFAKFREVLEQQHNWPSLYMFKFIAPKGKEKEVKKLFPKNDVVQKASRGGNYYSLTVKMLIKSSEEIIKVYKEVHKIDGVIPL